MKESIFKEGDRVKCIDGSAMPEETEKGIVFPKRNRIYEVRYVDEYGGLYLDGIWNDVDELINFESNKEPSFRQSRFERVNDRYLQCRLTQILHEAHLENQF